MEYKYCYLCGGKTEPKGEHGTTHWQCTRCGQRFYANPKPAGEAILVTEDYRVVVAIRAQEPYKGKFDIPGGFVDAGETFEQALRRELMEELGLAPESYSEPVPLPSVVDDYPWGTEKLVVLTQPFTARISSDVQLEAKDDVEKLVYKVVEDLGPGDFAWSSQYPLVVKAVEYWRSLIKKL